MTYANLNGMLLPTAEARVGILDHGLLYGDGLFETMRVFRGQVFRWEQHLARLRESADRIALPLPWTDAELGHAVEQVAQANGVTEGAARLTITRGEGPPVPDPAACGTGAFFITTRPAPLVGDDQFERGYSVSITGSHPRWIVPAVKSLSYGPFQRARHVARREGFDEGLLEWNGQIVEGATSNIFALTGGTLVTPGIESGCLTGISRGLVMELAAAEGSPVREGALTAADLLAAEEVFLTNSLLEVMPVVRLGGDGIGDGRPGAATRRLREAYRRRLEIPE